MAVSINRNPQLAAARSDLVVYVRNAVENPDRMVARGTDIRPRRFYRADTSAATLHLRQIAESGQPAATPADTFGHGPRHPDRKVPVSDAATEGAKGMRSLPSHTWRLTAAKPSFVPTT